MTKPPLAAILAAATVLAGCANAPTPEDVVAAERAFAADGYARGVKKSFLAFSAPDAVFFSPAPVNAHEALSGSPDEDPANPRPRLVWWPLYAGMAQSGDLGFTTGPFAIEDDRRGHYFTVWRKQPDGSWKWVLDAGVGADAAAEAPPGSPAAFLKGGARRSASPAAAMSEVAEAEKALAAAALSDLRSAYAPFLDADSRLHSDGPPPSKSDGGRDAQFDARPRTLEFRPLGGGSSNAGDFAWTYGEGRWREGGADRIGWYARIWIKRSRGWRLVFDEFIPPPPATAQ